MKLLVKPALAALALGALLACGGGSDEPAQTPPCDMACEDGVALRALRDAIKLVYNVKLQGQPVGPQEATTPCPLGGMAQVSGDASSNADQGATMVHLTYVFTECAYSETDTDPTQTFAMTLDGTVTETGMIAVQSSATTALTFDSESMTFAGTVYAPAKPYDESCTVQLEQNGNDLSGKLCGHSAGTSL